MDASREQTLVCKQNRNSANDVADKLCLSIKDGYFQGTVYNETLQFDVEVEEGWNQIALILSLDSTSTYQRLRMVAYSRSRVEASWKTFSYKYQDDVDYDLLFGGKYASDGLNITTGFTGYMLEIRLYSTVVLTLANLDD